MALSEHEQGFTIVAEGEPAAAAVWWSQTDSPVASFAVNEVCSYIERTSDARLPSWRVAVETPESLSIPSSGIAIVPTEMASQCASIMPASWLRPVSEKLADATGEAVVIENVETPAVVLAGDRDRSVLYAVYAFLEQLGVRFFAPNFDFYEGNAEHVPECRTLTAPRWNIYKQASFAYRRKYVEEGWSHTPENLIQLIDWMGKARLNLLVYPFDYDAHGVTVYDRVRPDIMPELTKRGMGTEIGGHGFNSWLPRAEYPEYYIEGYNVFDITNDAAIRTYVDNVVRYLRERPEVTVFDAWPPDGATWPPAALDQFGSVANAEAVVINALTNEVATQLPGVVVEKLAYVPEPEPPDPNYMYNSHANVVDVAPYDRSYRVPIGDRCATKNAYYDDIVKQWRRAYGGDLGIYEYYRKYSWHSLPGNVLELVGSEIAYYYQVGATGMGTYAEPGDWIAYEPLHLLIAALSWNVGLDVAAWRHDYLVHRFGNAEPMMAEYLGHVEDACRTLFTSPRGAYDDDRAVRRALAEFVAARDSLARARAVVTDDVGRWMIARLEGNADYAIADTESAHYEWVGDAAAHREAIARVADNVTAHAFDGVVLQNLFSMRRYQADLTREATRWLYTMYRASGRQGGRRADVVRLGDERWLWVTNMRCSTPIGTEDASAPQRSRLENTDADLHVWPYADLGYRLDGQWARFTAGVSVGGDGDEGLIFQVWADSVKVFDSGIVTPGSIEREVDVDLGSADRMRLVVLRSPSVTPSGGGGGRWVAPRVHDEGPGREQCKAG